jgi:hypothetical protein
LRKDLGEDITDMATVVPLWIASKKSPEPHDGAAGRDLGLTIRINVRRFVANFSNCAYFSHISWNHKFNRNRQCLKKKSVLDRGRSTDFSRHNLLSGSPHLVAMEISVTRKIRREETTMEESDAVTQSSPLAPAFRHALHSIHGLGIVCIPIMQRSWQQRGPLSMRLTLMGSPGALNLSSIADPVIEIKGGATPRGFEAWPKFEDLQISQWSFNEIG